MESVSDRDDVFTESVLFEILLSNPDELKKDSLMIYLRNKENPLPSYMLDILDEIALGTTTAKTVMQTRMATSKRDFTRAAGEIIRSLVNDTILDVYELRGWLANMDEFDAKMARGLAQAKAGEGVPADEFFASLRQEILDSYV